MFTGKFKLKCQPSSKCYYYREQLQNNANKGQYYLRVNMDDLNNFDDQLSTMVRNHPADYMPVVG